MVRLQTNAKAKVKKALTRVEKKVIMEIRKNIEQQRKWKAEIVKRSK